jgi:hypothetical protein
VPVILAVAIVALAGGVAISGLGLMTAFALLAGMGARQGEVGLAMPEAFTIQLHDHGRATLVVGVAVAAGLLRVPAMKTITAADVGTDVLVAVSAQLILPRAVEGNVAVAATGFVLGVPADEFTWHECLFERLRGDECGNKPQREARSGAQNSTCTEQAPRPGISTYARR